MMVVRGARGDQQVIQGQSSCKDTHRAKSDELVVGGQSAGDVVDEACLLPCHPVEHASLAYQAAASIRDSSVLLAHGPT